MKLIDKSNVISEIEKLRKNAWESFQKGNSTEEQYYIRYGVIQDILSFLDSLEVKESDENLIQYNSIEAGIESFAETYSFNIESILFPQLTEEQQKLWIKEIKQAVINGGDMGITLTKDMRYKENTLEVKEINLEDSVKETLAQKYIDYIFKRHDIDSESKERMLIYYAYMHGMNQCLTQLRAQNGKIKMKTGIKLIAEERQRQIEVEGWTKEHDAEYKNGELAKAAICYADPNVYYHQENKIISFRIPNYFWPKQWDRHWFKPTDRIRDLVKAGAFIAAEIDRLQAQKENK